MWCSSCARVTGHLFCSRHACYVGNSAEVPPVMLVRMRRTNMRLSSSRWRHLEHWLSEVPRCKRCNCSPGCHCEAWTWKGWKCTCRPNPRPKTSVCGRRFGERGMRGDEGAGEGEGLSYGMWGMQLDATLKSPPRLRRCSMLLGSGALCPRGSNVWQLAGTTADTISGEQIKSVSLARSH